MLMCLCNENDARNLNVFKNIGEGTATWNEGEQSLV